MVEVRLGVGTVTFDVLGWSQVWAFRRSITVPRTAIRTVKRAPPDVGKGWYKGWRIPGTHLPGVIVAGSFLRDGAWSFWDVRGSGRNAIEVHLTGTRYERLVIDVAHPDDTIRRLQSAAGGRG